jgi:hypothetical protein
VTATISGAKKPAGLPTFRGREIARRSGILTYSLRGAMADTTETESLKVSAIFLMTALVRSTLSFLVCQVLRMDEYTGKNKEKKNSRKWQFLTRVIEAAIAESGRRNQVQRGLLANSGFQGHLSGFIRTDIARSEGKYHGDQ